MSDISPHTRKTRQRRDAYRQYNLIVERGTALEAALEHYKEHNPIASKGKSPADRRGGLSEFIRECICAYLGITSWELYTEAGIEPRTGRRVQASHDLDMILQAAQERQEARQKGQA